MAREYTDEQFMEYLRLSTEREVIEDRLCRLPYVEETEAKQVLTLGVKRNALRQELSDLQDELKTTQARVYLEFLEGSDKKPTEETLKMRRISDPRCVDVQERISAKEYEILATDQDEAKHQMRLKRLETLKECLRGLLKGLWAEGRSQ